MQSLMYTVEKQQNQIYVIGSINMKSCNLMHNLDGRFSPDGMNREYLNKKHYKE